MQMPYPISLNQNHALINYLLVTLDLVNLTLKTKSSKPILKTSPKSGLPSD